MEQKWWQKFFGEKPPPAKVDVQHEVQALQDFGRGVPLEIHKVQGALKELGELAKEYTVAMPALQEVNLRSQAKVFEDLLERYESLQNDVDINGIRVKRLAEHWLQQAEKAGMHDLVKEKKKMAQWKMLW